MAGRLVAALGLCATLVTSLPAVAADSKTAAASSTLQRVQLNGDLRCGVFPDDPGRSAITTAGVWAGFYVDFCKAVAAAVIGNPDFVQYVEVGAKTRFTSLVERKTDVVMYSSTWTLGRESGYNVEFPTIYLFDGQGFLVRKRSGIRRVEDLKGKSICVTENTTSHRNLVHLIEHRQLGAQVLFSNGDSFFRGSCDAYSADRMNLATNRANRADNPADYLILPDVVSREPIGPTVRNDDPQWSRIVRSVVHALILAEEKGIAQSNVDLYLNGDNEAEVGNLLGSSGDIGAQLGLDKAWAYRVIKAVGNYGEIYDRHFGPGSAIGVERGLNRLWSQGGLLFAPPFK
ncbi:amino acid ABC transporter substrate-binding protein [Marinobacterium sp. CAU 1594]|nr:amino acid ABC transporter substrate-binding protein [Marinobacterium arenosum]